MLAVTQVTGYMAHTHDALGMLQGLLVLALLWWTWSGYAWLGNQARAVVVDWGGIYLTSRAGNLRIHSASHWTERQGQFVILAIGESVVAIGAGAAGQPIGAPLLAAAVLGVAAALGLWWLYFDVVSGAAEHRLRDARGQARVRRALEAYTYGHFPIVAGIIVGAVGVRGVLTHAGDDARPGGRATARHRVAADVTVAALFYPPGAVADRPELSAAARPAAWRPRRLGW